MFQAGLLTSESVDHHTCHLSLWRVSGLCDVAFGYSGGPVPDLYRIPLFQLILRNVSFVKTAFGLIDLLDLLAPETGSLHNRYQYSSQCVKGIVMVIILARQGLI